MSMRRIDASGVIVCPHCEGGDMSYVIIRSPVLTYKESGAQVAEHIGDTRDYRCANCGISFLVPQSELDSL